MLKTHAAALPGLTLLITNTMMLFYSQPSTLVGLEVCLWAVSWRDVWLTGALECLLTAWKFSLSSPSFMIWQFTCHLTCFF